FRLLARPTRPAVVVNVAADDTLNVRSGPGAGHFRVSELAPGAAVAVTEEAAVAADGGIWHLIVDDQSGPAG
ncbi:MAG: hypothetical protein OEM97_07710, partial [Acidimicrobiia bacterium]|nr:hypothetical protein [Acidimicrobiia bacterium]